MDHKTKDNVMYRLEIAEKTAHSLLVDIEVIRNTLKTENVPELEEFDDEADSEYPEDD